MHLSGWLFATASLLVGNVFGQASDTTWRLTPYSLQLRDECVLVMGYQQGSHGFVELGMGRNVGAMGHVPADVGYYLGGEMRVDDPGLFGVKVGMYVTGAAAFGMHVIAYTDGRDQALMLRPEIGIGILKARMTYAYNAKLSGTRLPGLNTHMLTLAYALRLFRLPRDSQYRP